MKLIEGINPDTCDDEIWKKGKLVATMPCGIKKVNTIINMANEILVKSKDKMDWYFVSEKIVVKTLGNIVIALAALKHVYPEVIPFEESIK